MRLPYQRVLKYHLLFNELLKQTDIEHSAKELIKITRDSMCEVGNFLNECQRDKENLTQIEKIMAHLTIDSKGSSNSSLKDYGHYIKDDKFRVKSIDLGERIARTRTFFLFEKTLLVCKSKGDLYNYKEALPIDEYTIEDPAVMSAAGNNSNSLDSNALNLSLIGNSGANAHNLVIYNMTRSKVYAFYFKNQEQKRIWRQCLNQAKEKIQPKGQRHNKHMFVFSNFKHEMATCVVCKHFLLGIFYQGYRCDLCAQVAHKDCLLKTSLCTVAAATPTHIVNPQQFSSSGKNNLRINSMSALHQTAPKITLERSVSICSASSSKQSSPSFCVRAIYKYDGRPPPPEFPILMFNEGDLIQVTDEDDDYWWKGYLIKSKRSPGQHLTKEEGYFPSSYVKQYAGDSSSSLPNSLTAKNNLDEYSWFAPVDRNTADLILNRIQNFPSQTLFMVRCRQEGGYAISIKCNGLVDHIKINVTYLDPIGNSLALNLQQNLNFLNSAHLNHEINTNASAFYSIDQRNFSSVINLVKFYCQNTLKENFPQLETTLGTPYRDALPTPISVAIAMHDYDPLTNPNNTGEQIELKTLSKYFILNKEPNGWWRVYNSDGLIGYAPGGYLQETKIQ